MAICHIQKINSSRGAYSASRAEPCRCYRGGVKSRVEPPANNEPAKIKGVPVARTRRAPRPIPFLLSGFIIGGIIGWFFGKGGDNGGYTDNAGASYLFLLFGVMGLAVGGIAFILFDRRS